jgi:hypothetical protein
VHGDCIGEAVQDIAHLRMDRILLLHVTRCLRSAVLFGGEWSEQARGEHGGVKYDEPLMGHESLFVAKHVEASDRVAQRGAEEHV